MRKKELLLELLKLVENICKDGIVYPSEVEKMQDWLDENSVDFVGEEYNVLICPLQNFLDDGEFCSDEQNKLIKIINSLISLN